MQGQVRSLLLGKLSNDQVGELESPQDLPVLKPLSHFSVQ